jgi:K(+)-stimulated pyrophosphate-energized sodium pump
MNYYYLVFCIAAVAVAVCFIVYLFFKVKKQPVNDPKIKEIQGYIKEGAMAFLKREYKILAIFVAALAILIAFLLSVDGYEGSGISTAASFLVGAGFSALAGYIGMRTAVHANGRTTQAAKDKGMKGALSVAFSGGTIMGLVVVSLGILGLGGLIMLFYAIYGEIDIVITIITGFSLGASSIALFSRVGGGIYTKAADVGADLVGKVEKGIPEDDPRNPAVIADNVGDNVGDVAGMGADLFESYVGSIIASIALGAVMATKISSNIIYTVLFPLFIAAGGLIGAIIGSLCVRSGDKPHRSLKIGTYVAAAFSSAVTLALSLLMFESADAFFAAFFGIVVGIVIGQITEYYTSDRYKHVKYVKKMSETGAATNIIAGLSVGMLSTTFVILLIGAAILGANYFGGIYGIALAAVGMLSTAGITIAVDAYGPIADNAGGIAEMAGLDESVRDITDTLDAVGNTTAAIGKGFAIGSAALTSLALFVTFIASFNTAIGDFVNITLLLNLADPVLIAGALAGGMLPFLFSSFTMKSVGKAAGDMIEEVRRQFKDPAIMEGTKKPDYAKCVDISTKAALREMIVPGVLALAAPIVAGILLGYVGLSGLLAGSLISGIVMAIFMSNTGGIWDNVKKSLKADGLKGTDTHNAAVIGDTVGDPFKDTSGPSINILIKLMTIMSLVFIPVFAAINNGRGLLG